MFTIKTEIDGVKETVAIVSRDVDAISILNGIRTDLKKDDWRNQVQRLDERDGDDHIFTMSSYRAETVQ